MQKILFTLIMNLLVFLNVRAEWKVVTTTDAITDKVMKTALIKNEIGHTFSIYRIKPGGEVWGNFAISEDIFDQIDPQKPPIYRIDNYEPLDLNLFKKMQDSQKAIGMDGMQLYSWSPKWVNFAFWQGNEDEGINGKIVELMEGEKILFRYYLFTGGFKDTTFELKGAAEAISEATGIPAKIDHAEQKKIIEFNEAVYAENKKCSKNTAKSKQCSARVGTCKDQSNKNIEKFKSCLK